MNTRNLIRWAGVSAMVAGICFVVVGLLEPPEVLASVTTTRWATANVLAIAMSVFGLLGITGLYARQAEAAGWLGLLGYLLWSLWMTLALIFNFFEAFVLPLLATRAPTFAESILRVVTRSAGEMDFEVLAGLWAVSDITFVIGGLVFGITTLRAGVLSRRAAGMLTVGIAVAPAYGLLPNQIESVVAVPIGMGLAWLGWGLWTERRGHAAAPVPGLETPRFRPTAAK